MIAALGWGALGASSLVIGALAGVARPWPPRVVGLVLGFGAGALISAVSFELAEEGLQVASGWAVAAGLALGALTYYVADGLIGRRAGGSDAGGSLAHGAVHGIPEQLVLGLGVAIGDGVSAGLLAAIFVSNLPEAIGSATAMRAGGVPRATIMRLWLGVAAVCTVASVIGFAVADSVPDELQGGANGFAAGALIVMLVDSMIPDARRSAGRPAGLVTVLGFAVAAGLSAS